LMLWWWWLLTWFRWFRFFSLNSIFESFYWKIVFWLLDNWWWFWWAFGWFDSRFWILWSLTICLITFGDIFCNFMDDIFILLIFELHFWVILFPFCFWLIFRWFMIVFEQ
jgi:hypothetical protein